jgi:hypothetical protein
MQSYNISQVLVAYFKAANQADLKGVWESCVYFSHNLSLSHLQHLQCRDQQKKCI